MSASVGMGASVICCSVLLRKSTRCSSAAALGWQGFQHTLHCRVTFESMHVLQIEEKEEAYLKLLAKHTLQSGLAAKTTQENEKLRGEADTLRKENTRLAEQVGADDWWGSPVRLAADRVRVIRRMQEVLWVRTVFLWPCASPRARMLLSRPLPRPLCQTHQVTTLVQLVIAHTRSVPPASPIRYRCFLAQVVALMEELEAMQAAWADRDVRQRQQDAQMKVGMRGREGEAFRRREPGTRTCLVFLATRKWLKGGIACRASFFPLRPLRLTLTHIPMLLC